MLCFIRVVCLKTVYLQLVPYSYPYSHRVESCVHNSVTMMNMKNNMHIALQISRTHIFSYEDHTLKYPPLIHVVTHLSCQKALLWPIGKIAQPV